jgi:hypothetical protein
MFIQAMIISTASLAGFIYLAGWPDGTRGADALKSMIYETSYSADKKATEVKPEVIDLIKAPSTDGQSSQNDPLEQFASEPLYVPCCGYAVFSTLCLFLVAN